MTGVIDLKKEQIQRLKNYSLEEYISDVENLGLEETWKILCDFVLSYGENESFLNVKKFGEMYETGLAIRDKLQKKNNGQYYTPEDVALVMSRWFQKCEGENVCDVACGTGKLILSYLELLGKEKAVSLIKSGKLYLYDSDGTALNICRTSILLKYGKELDGKINAIHCDFLSEKIKLPENSKTISNPPYASIKDYGNHWKITDVVKETSELYSSFMEKIIRESKSTVIITPFSFISSSKFFSLRKVLNDYNGEIYSFDNVPGNIFCGRKHGIFNTNTSNAVRAAITVVRTDNSDGFRTTPLIRFKSTEREKLLTCETLEKFLSDEKQKITEENTMYHKCFKELENLYERFVEKSKGKVFKSLLNPEGNLTLSMPNTCRYYTTAFSGTLKRHGQITLKFHDEDKFNYAFCLINSSFTYWHWRLFDGGITYPSGLLMKLPVFYESLSKEDKEFFKKITEEMKCKAKDFIIRKNNVGLQENIKYPRKYRDEINQRFFKILGIEMENSTMDLIHSNMALEVNV